MKLTCLDSLLLPVGSHRRRKPQSLLC